MSRPPSAVSRTVRPLAFSTRPSADRASDDLGRCRVDGHVVDPAAEIAGNQPGNDADRATHQDGTDADQERNARAIKQARQHVTAEAIGAKEEEGVAAPFGQRIGQAHHDVLPVGIERR